MPAFQKPDELLQRAFLVGVQTPGMKPGEGAELLAELTELVENLDLTVTNSTLVNLKVTQARFFIGSGKAAELAAQAKAEGAQLIVFDEELSPGQQKNWEEEFGLAVIDRQEVILEIFADRARTREAVLQVALARMEYSLPRLTRAWSHLSRQRGKGAMGGEGETQLEQDRRIVRDRITHLKTEIATVLKQREVQRRKRARQPVPSAAIVGYTNAGKSSLLNKLTGAQLYAADKLFATLDPTTRQFVLPDDRTLLVTDTVGFIRRLPHRLIEAFKATLEEVVVSDFLIHVLDVTNPSVDQHQATTLAVLAELGAGKKPTITVYNKIDAVDATTLAAMRAQHPDALFLSVHTGAGMDALLRRCSELAVDDYESAELLIPHNRYDLVSKLHTIGHVRAQDTHDDGVLLSGRFPIKSAPLYADFLYTPPAPAEPKKKAGRKKK
ncbi:MAG: GTPase HflX [Opitutae bacterium]|nr:GTPase HflX [Opitutae bacterium]